MNLQICKIRESEHYSKSQIAEVLGCSLRTYSKYESGEVMISLKHLMMLADFYNTSLDYLLGLTDVIEPHTKKN